MKITTLLSITTILASLLPSQISAETTASVGFPAHAVSAANTTIPVIGARIALGDTQKTVEKKLGIPMTRLSPDAWLYENVEITLAGQSQPQPKNIYVAFIDGKLSTLAIVGDQKRDRLIATARSQTNKTVAITSAE